MTEGMVVGSLISFLDKYVFGGVASRLVVDVSKGAYGKLRHRSWEDLYLEAFRQALHESRDLLSKYAAADGETDLLVKQFNDSLTCDLGVDLATTSEATLTSAEFGQRLAAALARRQALIIGGNNLSEADYTQIMARLGEQAQSIFRTEVQGNPAAFQQSVLAASRETLERDRKTQASTEEIERLVGQVDAFLRDRFGMVLAKLDEIHQDVKDTREAVRRLSSPAVPSALNYMPPPPDDFVGRGRETQTLLAALRSGGATISGAAKAGVAGMAGVGKTALALYVAHQVAGEYATHIYLDLKGTANPPPSATDAMLSVVRAFDESLDTSKLTADDIKRLYFSRLHGRRALLVLDNAADAWQVGPLMPGQGCAVLVTSRRTFVVPGLKPLLLEVLLLDEARSLLLQICPRTGTAATDLAVLCGRLPLALRLAASHLAERPDLPVAEYLETLTERRTRLAALKSEGHPDLDVEAAFELSYERLEAQDQERWRAFSVFPAPFDAAAAAAVWGVDEAEDCGLLSELARVSMVEYDEASKRYHLHDLLAAFAEARLSPQESMAGQRRHARHFLRVAAQADDLYLRGGQEAMAGLRLFDTEWPHIRAGQAWAADNADRDDDAARLTMRYPNAGVFCMNLRLRPRERVAWLQAAVAAARTAGRRREEGASLGNLGIAYMALGEVTKAVEYHQQTLALSREIGDRKMEASALGSLGSAYLALGQAAKAEEHHRQALAISREIGDRRGEGVDLGNLGLVYHDVGQAARAEEHQQQALAIFREIGDRQMEGNSLGNLGLVYQNMGQVAKAVEYHLQALTISREIGDRQLEANSLGNVGSAYQELGQVAKAAEYHLQALAISREIGDRCGEGNTLGNLGNIYLALGLAAKAGEYHEQALEISRETGDRQMEWTSLANLASAYGALRLVRKVAEHYQEALVILRQLADPARTCWILRLLGNLLNDQDTASSEAAYREALTLQPEDQRNYVGIVLQLRQQGREREAIPLLLKRAELVPDNAYPALALACIYRQLGDEALSAEHAARARELLKPEDSHSLACLESVCGNTEAALDHLRRVAGEPDFRAAGAWADPDLQWIRDDPRFAETVGPKPGKAEAEGEHETPENETQG